MRKHLKRLMKLEELTMVLVTFELDAWLNDHPPKWDSAISDWNFEEWFKTVPEHLEDNFVEWYGNIVKRIHYLNSCKRNRCCSQEQQQIGLEGPGERVLSPEAKPIPVSQSELDDCGIFKI